MTETLTIRRPDDWHVHLRDAAMLESVVAATARQFARAIVMPNLAACVIMVIVGILVNNISSKRKYPQFWW